jgi:hypothetical protein
VGDGFIASRVPPLADGRRMGMALVLIKTRLPSAPRVRTQGSTAAPRLRRARARATQP